MKKRILKISMISMFLSLTACDNLDDFIGGGMDSSKELLFIDEFVIPDGEQFEGTLVGGLSGIDYANGVWYLISDDPNTPRFYTASLGYNSEAFNTVNIQSVVTFKDEMGDGLNDGITDPEAIRYDNGTIVWTSEGNINNNLPPSVNFASSNGVFAGVATLPERYNPQESEDMGPRQNGVFEGISLSADRTGYWVNMELPLREDGPAPTTEDTDSPIRIAFIDRVSREFGREFAYELDPVVRPAANGTSFELNGVVEILEYEKDQFLILERSFSTGYDDGGNNVKIYDVDASQATDISGIDALANTDYQVAKKTLLFDFEEIRDQLTDGVVDNIEGIVFGPNFPNGNKSVVLVADNNFSAVGPQLNQFVLFELKK